MATNGTQISDMTDSLTDFPDGAFVPFVVEAPVAGLFPSQNYRFNLGARLLNYITSALLAAPGGSALIGFLSNGVGAVSRTVQGKLRDTVSVKDFGAVGDGTTDDTAAIQAAFAALSPYAKLWFPAGTYLVSAPLTLAVNNVTIEGPAKILSAATSNYDFVFRATGLTGVTVRDLEFDVNQAARASIQTVRFHGPYINSCTNFTFDNVTVRNTLGYGGISAVGIAIGQGTRCSTIDCRIIDCGTDTLTSDGIYTSGTQNVIANCITKNCTDTAYVIENSNYSVISGCTSDGCAAGAAVTLSLSGDYYGNMIDGLTVKNWNAPSTGGVQIGTLASTGNLYGTTITGLNMYASEGGGYGLGAAVWVRRVGSGNTIGLNISGFNIDGGQFGVRVNDAAKVNLTGGTVRNMSSSAFLFLAGGPHVMNACYIDGAARGIDVQGTGTSVRIKNCAVDATTSAAIQALNTSIVNISGLDIIGVASGSRVTKDSGATINYGGFVNNIRTNTAATATVDYTDGTIIQTTAASVYTLPAANMAMGQTIRLVTQFAGTVTSASSNVVPLAGGAAAADILPATAGKWAVLQSDGANWRIVEAN